MTQVASKREREPSIFDDDFEARIPVDSIEDHLRYPMIELGPRPGIYCDTIEDALAQKGITAPFQLARGVSVIWDDAQVNTDLIDWGLVQHIDRGQRRQARIQERALELEGIEERRASGNIGRVRAVILKLVAKIT